jgi:hypothetical protein
MPSIILLLSIITVFAQDQNKLTGQLAAEGWVLLYDGQSAFGWTPEGGSEWNTTPEGDLVAKSGDSGIIKLNTVFGDYDLRCEFKTPIAKGSAIVLNGVEVKPPRTGDKWRVLEASAVGGRIVAKVDGKKVADRKTDQPGTIALRFTKGDHLAIRNLRLLPRGLTPLFNGRDLGGWKVVERPQAKVPAVWSVRDGAIHVEHGPGQLETDGRYKDFVLRLDVRTNSNNPKLHPNSGVFLRGDPDGFFTGYESQIRNEYREDDRSKPVDFGTGAIYHYSPARRVISSDNEFFTKTIVARGRHFSIWVNGIQVTDWEDPHPEGNAVRNKQARLGAGTISLQAHDPTTTLDFRNLRIAELK